jgi:hypothetical protein
MTKEGETDLWSLYSTSDGVKICAYSMKPRRLVWKSVLTAIAVGILVCSLWGVAGSVWLIPVELVVYAVVAH